MTQTPWIIDSSTGTSREGGTRMLDENEKVAVGDICDQSRDNRIILIFNLLPTNIRSSTQRNIIRLS